MHIEIDVELEINLQSQPMLTNIVAQLPEKYATEHRKTDGFLHVVYEDASISSKPLDEGIIFFLNGLVALREKISTLNACVRVGMFYQAKETIVCPMRLSKQCIKMLNQFGVSLDVTGYPCSDDEPE